MVTYRYILFYPIMLLTLLRYGFRSYLLGFRKRKLERKEKAKKEMLQKFKEEKRKVKEKVCLLIFFKANI